MSHLEDDGMDIEVLLSLIANGDVLIVQDLSDSTNYQHWVVNAAPTLTPNSHLAVPVTLNSSGGTGTTNFPNNHQLLVFWGRAPAGANYGAMQLVSRQVLAAPGNTFTFTGLDLDADETYIIRFGVANAGASLSIISLFFNNDTTATNYRGEVGSEGGAGTHVNNATISAMDTSANGGTLGSIEIWKPPSGQRVRAVSRYVYGPFSSSMQVSDRGMQWATTGSNVTRIDVFAETQNFAANSYASLYRLAPVQAATPQFDPRRTFDWFEDCTAELGTTSSDSEWVTNLNGAGAAVALVAVAGVPGVWQFTSGTASNGSAFAIRANTDSNTSTPTVTLDASQSVEFHARLRVPTLPDATNTFIADAGWREAFTLNPLVIMRMVYDSGSGNVYFGALVRNAAGTSTSSTFTSGPVVAANTWYRMKIAALSGSIAFYANDNLLGTITTNTPTEGMTMYTGITKSAGTTSRTVQVDYLWTHMDFLIRR